MADDSEAGVPEDAAGTTGAGDNGGATGAGGAAGGVVGAPGPSASRPPDQVTADGGAPDLAGLEPARAEAELKQWIRDTEEECLALLARAERQASRLRLEARRLKLAGEAEFNRRRTQAEADALRREAQAHQDASGIVSEAERNAGEILRRAHEEAARIRDMATATAAKHLEQAQERAQELLMTAGQEIEAWQKGAEAQTAEAHADLSLLRDGLAELVHDSEGLLQQALKSLESSSGADPGGPAMSVVSWTTESWRPEVEPQAGGEEVVGVVGESADPEWKQLVDAARENRLNVLRAREEAGDEPDEPSPDDPGGEAG